jgi:uncharacterized membrane protein
MTEIVDKTTLPVEPEELDLTFYDFKVWMIIGAVLIIVCYCLLRRNKLKSSEIN